MVRALLSRGHTVRALVRDTEKASRVLPADRRVTLVKGDVRDPAAVAELFSTEPVAMIHLIGIIRAAGDQTFQGMHVGATTTILEACRQHGCRRYVHMSAMGVSSDGRAEYQRTKHEAELLVRRSGLEWTIFRPGLIHGADGELVGMIRKWCRGEAPPFFFIPYFTRLVERSENAILSHVGFEAPTVAPVHVSDVAEAFASCLDRPQTVQEIYNLAGPERMTWKEMLTHFKQTLPGADTSLPVIGLPARPHAYMAMAAGRLGLGGLFPFDAGQAFMAEGDMDADLEKAQAHLGFSPRGFKASLGSYAGELA